MKVELERARCLLCGNVGLSFLHTVRDDNTRVVGQCRSCSHVQLSPLPSIEEDALFYNGANITGLFKGDKNWTNLEWLSARYRPYAENQAKNFVRYVTKKERIMEVGSGYGHLVEILLKEGYTIHGIEISEAKRELYHKRTGDNLLGVNLLLEMPESLYESYDVACAFQTLEHISEPIVFVERMARMIKPGGRIYIEVPNENDFLKAECKAYEDFTYCRAHLSYFTPQSLTILLEKNGFSDIQIFGYQVFSIENALWWIRKGEPFKEYHQINPPTAIQFADEYYKRKLEEKQISNCIIAIGRKA